jgi:hypothetical protein
MRHIPLLLILGLGLIEPPAVSAQGLGDDGNRQLTQSRDLGFRGFGPRIGVSIDPNQIVVGGHGDFGDLFPQTAWLFPVVEIGLGDNVTVVSLGTDLLIRARETFGVWNPYAGGELAFVLTTAGGADAVTDLGLSGVVGVAKLVNESGRFAGEVKFGIIDSPTVKFLVRWTFVN